MHVELWDEWRGSLDGRPTMWISRLLKLPFWRRAGKWLSCRVDLHKFIDSDDFECFHSHPSYAIRIVLWGGYVEETPSGDMKVWSPGMAGLIRPEFVHRVSDILNGRASYSLWLRGPICADVKLVGDGWAQQRASASTGAKR
jgi:hypothetical protein